LFQPFPQLLLQRGHEIYKLIRVSTGNNLGELKVVNFETYLAGKTTAFVAPNQTVVGFLHYNYTSFSSTPRVIVSMKSYGVFPSTTFTSLSMGYRFSIVSRNATNLTYSVTAIGVTLMALHYQYFAVVGYTNLYHMQFYTIPCNFHKLT
jgi:hypothetical protein